jgi:hypothetical protein
VTLEKLHPNHRAMLERESGLRRDVIDARGYRTVTTEAELQPLKFAPTQQLVPGLLIPIHTVDGKIAAHQLRPDKPRTLKKKKIKYETPKGSRIVLDCHPFIRSLLSDPTIPLWLTEGSKKADSLVSHGRCAIALLGVWGWRGSNGDGGKTLLPDWELVALNGRLVYVVFDSDVMLKREVHNAMTRLGAFLKSRGATVRYVYLPCDEIGAKCGVDDFLVAGHTIDDLIALSSPTLRPLASKERPPQGVNPYQETEHGIVLMASSGPKRLTNFTARITAEIVRDDGVEAARHLELDATVRGKRTPIELSTQDFREMNWAIDRLGCGAIVYPGSGTRDHARAAIQLLSTNIQKRVIYTHLGWRDLGEQGWVYLHANEAIGPIGQVGPLPGIEVVVQGELRRFALPEPLQQEPLRQAIRASLQILELGPKSLTTPLYAAIFAPLMGHPDFTVFLTGKTGTFKTQMAALAQQHYGAGMDGLHLPGSWLSTANALQGLAFLANNTLLVIDDFAPGGSHTDIQRLHHQADTLLRGQGNGSGRQRMRQDTSLRSTKPSRCLMLCTGEDIPKGHSLRARMVVLEVHEGDINPDSLTLCQADASAGQYAAVIASYVAWLAKDYGRRRKTFAAEVAALRDETTDHGLHRRTPQAIAYLGASLKTFLQFAEEMGAVPLGYVASEWPKHWAHLQASALGQTEHHTDSNPVTRYGDLLRGVFAAGRGHLEGMGYEEKPADARAWGWQKVETGKDTVWRGMGARLGWLDTTRHLIYLNPQAAYAAVQQLARDNGEPLTLACRTMGKRLKEAGWLVGEPSRPHHLTTRVTIHDQRTDVYAIPQHYLYCQGVDQLDQLNQSCASRNGGQPDKPLLSQNSGAIDLDAD